LINQQARGERHGRVRGIRECEAMENALPAELASIGIQYVPANMFLPLPQ